MSARPTLQPNVLNFPTTKNRKKVRKGGVNRNKEGSVRKINGRVYIDFRYLGERVREASGLVWSEENVRIVRKQLDKIVASIQIGTFNFSEVFPDSPRKEYFTAKECAINGIEVPVKEPGDVTCGQYIQEWYEKLRGIGRVSERTMLGYKSHINLYLMDFFGQMTFVELSLNVLEKFTLWSRGKKIKGREVGNQTINKCLTLFKRIYDDAVINYRWRDLQTPFFGYKKLPESDPYEKIFPFTVDEQDQLNNQLSEHWKPYFKFAFCSGLRQGEQIGLYPKDIDWESELLHVRRAITKNEEGKIVEGPTKNKYSRRSIKLIPTMKEALLEQKMIYEKYKGKYFFCNTAGARIDSSTLRRNAWLPALKKAGLKIREVKQTRHTFATIALSCGENPLWVAKVMGHRDTDMVSRVYAKYIENFKGSEDGLSLNKLYQGDRSKDR